MNGPDQNAINLTNIELPDACKSLLSKGPIFVPTPYDTNWYDLRQDVDNFVNKLGFTLQNFIQFSTEPLINNDKQQ